MDRPIEQSLSDLFILLQSNEDVRGLLPTDVKLDAPYDKTIYLDLSLPDHLRIEDASVLIYPVSSIYTNDPLDSLAVRVNCRADSFFNSMKLARVVWGVINRINNGDRYYKGEVEQTIQPLNKDDNFLTSILLQIY